MKLKQVSSLSSLSKTKEMSNPSSRNGLLSKKISLNSNISLLITPIFSSISKDTSENIISETKRIILNIFIYNSEFSQTYFEFFISYRKIFELLREIGLIDIKSNDPSKLKKAEIETLIKKISNSNLNYSQFMQFIGNLAKKYNSKLFEINPKEEYNQFVKNHFNEYFKKIIDTNKSFNNNSYFIVEKNVKQVRMNNKIRKILKENKDPLEKIYSSFFKHELFVKSSIEKFAKISFSSLLNFCKSYDICPIKITNNQLAMYYFLINELYHEKNIHYIENNKGIVFTFEKFCLFILVISVVLYDFYHPPNDSKSSPTFNNYENEDKLLFFLKQMIFVKTDKKIDKHTRELETDSIYSGKDYSMDLTYEDEYGKKENDEYKTFEKYKIFLSNIFSQYSISTKNEMDLKEFISFLRDFHLIEKENIEPYEPISSRYSTKKSQINNNYFKHSLSTKRTSGKLRLNAAQILYFKIVSCNPSHKMNFMNFLMALKLIEQNYIFETSSTDNIIEHMLNYQNKKGIKNQIILYYNYIQNSRIYHFLFMISNIFEKYFLLYAEENEIPFTKFVQFFRDFKIFPDFINMCTLKLLFLTLTKDNNAQNQSDEWVKNENKQKMNIETFMISLGITGILLKTNIVNTNEEKVLLLIENCLQSKIIDKEEIDKILLIIKKFRGEKEKINKTFMEY